jgi:2-polyprenyl-3-methyl-5-hydroxy-6-metoxy-1,4-benzoquinol methylase
MPIPLLGIPKLKANKQSLKTNNHSPKFLLYQRRNFSPTLKKNRGESPMSSILEQQIEYYRARAAEYDEWFYRQGRYDRGEESNQAWFEEAAEVREALLALPKQEHILELAAGTGIWTVELLKIAKHLTIVDASPEMLAINQAKHQAGNVTVLQADLFKWQPEKQYDMIFFGFWLSHVPAERLQGFLQNVSAALKPDGILFMVDSRRTPDSTAKDHHLPEEGTTLERKLNDGRKFEIVKIFYEPQSLEESFCKVDIAATAQFTDNFFIYVEGRKVSIK